MLSEEKSIGLTFNQCLFPNHNTIDYHFQIMCMLTLLLGKTVRVFRHMDSYLEMLNVKQTTGTGSKLNNIKHPVTNAELQQTCNSGYDNCLSPLVIHYFYMCSD